MQPLTARMNFHLPELPPHRDQPDPPEVTDVRIIDARTA
jgi:hypothetical protein